MNNTNRQLVYVGYSAAENEDEDEESYGSDSDDSMVLSRRKSGPVRRSGRNSNRMTRFDREFSKYSNTNAIKFYHNRVITVIVIINDET